MLLTSSSPCAGLASNSTLALYLQFDVVGSALRGQGALDNVGATLDIRLQLDGNQITGTISGTAHDESFANFPAPQVLAFPPSPAGALEELVGTFNSTLSVGSGSINGQPTITIPSSPAQTGVCTAGQLRWLLQSSSS